MKLKSLLGSLGLILALGSAALTTRLHGTSAIGSDEANIAIVTARLLEHSGYSGHREAAEVSSKFLDRYLEILDGNRLYFLESDLEEFAPYRTNLEALTLKGGDTRPAHKMFERLQQRREQQGTYVQQLLKTEIFDFTGNDSYLRDRQHAPFARNLAEAKDLWRQQLRYEYLQEKLNNKKPDEIVQTLSRRYERSLHALSNGRRIRCWRSTSPLSLMLTTRIQIIWAGARLRIFPSP